MSGVYYNEWDPFAAAWLRELIKAGEIPDGEVDTRSILDVRAGDLAGFRQCHFFAGIGGWAYAFRLAGVSPQDEAWSGSCPCQPLSSAGKRQGHADERHIWPAFYDLVAERRPAKVFGEQVANPLGCEWLAGVRADLEGLQYAIGAACLRLVASARRTSAIAISGWPTPVEDDANNATRASGAFQSLTRTALTAAWPTPMAGSPATEEYNAAGNTDSSRKTMALLAPWATPVRADGRGSAGVGKPELPNQVQTLAAWTTPQAHDAQGTVSAERIARHGTTHGNKNLQDEVHLEGWATPKERDWRSESAKPETLAKIMAHPRGKDLNMMVAWATPRAEDAESSGMRHSRGVADTLTAQASLSAAQTENGAASPPTKRASLNPYFSLWLMGFPIAWGLCAGRVTRSTRSLRHGSSKQLKAQTDD